MLHVCFGKGARGAQSPILGKQWVFPIPYTKRRKRPLLSHTLRLDTRSRSFVRRPPAFEKITTVLQSEQNASKM